MLLCLGSLAPCAVGAVCEFLVHALAYLSPLLHLFHFMNVPQFTQSTVGGSFPNLLPICLSSQHADNLTLSETLRTFTWNLKARRKFLF